MAPTPFEVVHDAINTALDGLAQLPVEAHGRETGQVEYKLNEAKLWFGVVPGAIEAIVTAREQNVTDSGTPPTAPPLEPVADTPADTPAPADAPVSRENPVTAPVADTPADTPAEPVAPAPAAPDAAAPEPTTDIPAT